MDRAAKRARCADLLHRGNISVRGLHSLLQRLDPESASMNDLVAADHMALNSVLCSENVALRDGSEFVWEMAEPILLLQHFVNS